MRDLFVGQSLADQFKDGALPILQAVEPIIDPRATACVLTVTLVLRKRPADAFPQLLLGAWFLQEINRSGLHRLDGHLHVGVAGEEDDRQLDPLLDQVLLQLQPVHPGHEDIQHETAWSIGRVGVQKTVA